MKTIKYIFLFISYIALVSCDDYLDIEPVGKIIPKTVKDYRSFLTSAYNIKKSHKILTTYSADELKLSKDSQGVEQYKDIYTWNVTNPDPRKRNFPYSSFYKTIFYANHVINNSENMEGDNNEKNQLVGEAYALRAMQYFDLINLYAKPYNASSASSDKGVPITTEYDSEKEYPVHSVEKVYNLILSDISEAEKRLNVNQQKTGYNYRFSVIAVKSLKARVLLYQNKWQEAINASEKALAIKSALTNLNKDSNKMPSEYDSVESILALDEVSSFDISVKTEISESLINSYDNINDLRFALYFSKNSNNRYNARKNANAKYKCSYRTSELYLTIAEALTQLNKTDLAKVKLIEFTKNRYTSTGWNTYKTKVNSLSKEALLTEILEERRREFAIEGHRWNDLRRTTQPEITKIYNGKTYALQKNDSRYVIPFPKNAIINNPNL